MRQVIVHDEAEAEFREAAIFYESQASGLGDDLIAEVKGAIESVVRYPEAGPVVRGGARRRLVLRFPYAVIYRIEPDRIVVLAVMHTSRRPGYWRRRQERPL